MKKLCNICGHDIFAGGPNGRMSPSGLPPRCTKCQSLERHRIFRKIFLALKDTDFSAFKVLMFSSDPSVEPNWFSEFEYSKYEEKNSLDLQKIDRLSGSYDLVICNHVLEHVADDNAALNELGRIIKDNGFVFLSVPRPHHQLTTDDWGYPDKNQHYHYRNYGSDIVKRFKSYIPHIWVLSIIEDDNVTGLEDIVYFLVEVN